MCPQSDYKETGERLGKQAAELRCPVGGTLAVSEAQPCLGHFQLFRSLSSFCVSESQQNWVSHNCYLTLL